MIADVRNIDFSKPLPGSRAHRTMSPSGRLPMPFVFAERPVSSAVMLLIYREENEDRLVFIKRSRYPGVHGGQMAFPGGRAEESDTDLWQTAERELREETGISLPIRRLGQLSSLYVPPSGYMIHPFVAYCDSVPHFTPDQREVELLFSERIMHFASPESLDSYIIYTDNRILRAPCFVSHGYPIWGATAMILSEFLLLLQDSNTK